jgi:putative flippase GtrA
MPKTKSLQKLCHQFAHPFHGAFPAMTIHRELARYGVIGLFISLLYGVVLSAFVELAGLNSVYAHALTFVPINLLSYLLQSRFVFKRAIRFHAYLRFFAAYLLSYMATLITAYITEQAGIHYLVGYLLIAAVIPIFSFALLRRWVFRNSGRAGFSGIQGVLNSRIRTSPKQREPRTLESMPSS